MASTPTGLTAPRPKENIPEFPAPLPDSVKAQFPELVQWESKNREQWKKIVTLLGFTASEDNFGIDE